jgi:putative Mg2+ transporter-C (MgtC) family protein
VTLGAAAYVLASLSITQAVPGDLLRVVQGVVIGIGFLGSGAILKAPGTQRVRGLTTAGGIWNAAAVGVAVGAGQIVLAVALTAITLAVLGILGLLEERRRVAKDGSPRRP